MYQQQMLGNLSEIIILVFSLPIMLLAILNYSQTSKKSTFKYLLFIIANIVFIILNSIMIRDGLLTGALISTIITGSLAYLILNKYIYHKSVYLIPFILSAGYIIYKLYLFGDPNMVFVNSRNYVSFILIVSIIPYYFVTFRDGLNAKLRFSYYPAIITFLISSYTFGRSGVVSSFIILLALLIYWGRNNMKRKIGVLFFAIFIVLGFIYYLDVMNAYEELQRFKTMKDGGRTNIIAELFDSNSYYNYLVGFDASQLATYITYGHLHSSLLNYFSVVGIIFFAYTLLCINFMYKLFLKNNYPMILLLVAFFIRISTDVGVGFSFMDYLLWLPILSSFKMGK